jgi:hypothetical protein
MARRFVTAQFDRGQKPLITVVNEAKTPWGVAQNALVAALQKYVDERFAPVWGVPATLASGSAIKKGNWGPRPRRRRPGGRARVPRPHPGGPAAREDLRQTTISSKNLVSDRLP